MTKNSFNKDQNLIVAFGGISPEHEVSVLTAIQASSALQNSEWNLIPLYLTKNGRWLTGTHLLELESFKDLREAENKGTPCHFSLTENGFPLLVARPEGWFARTYSCRITALLCAFHGGEGENGAFQGLCETYSIPYTGSGVAASAIGMNKYLAKELCRRNKIPVVDDVLVREEAWISRTEQLLKECEKLGYPLYVKPVTLGSSIGVHRVTGRPELNDAVEESFRYDNQLLVEKAVHPLTEVNCSVLDSVNGVMTSVCEQPTGKEQLLTFEDKYLQGDGPDKGMASANRKIPAPISKEKTKAIQQLSQKIFRLIGCSGVARLDFLLNSDTGDLYFNEINTIPGSFSFYLWEASELRFDRLLEELVATAVHRHQLKNRRVRSYDVNLLSQKAVQGLKGIKGEK